MCQRYRETICSFIPYLFDKRKFFVHTVATYKASKVSRTRDLWNHIVQYHGHSIRFCNLMSDKFNVNPPSELQLKITFFFFALVTEGRVSKIYCLKRDDKYVKLTKISAISTFSTSFFRKKEDPVNRIRKPPIC